MREQELRAIFDAVERLYRIEGAQPWVERLVAELERLSEMENLLVMLFGPPESSPGSPVGAPLGVALRGSAAEILFRTTQELVISPAERDDAFRDVLARCFSGPPAFSQAQLGADELMAGSRFGQALRGAGIVDQAVLATTNSGAPALLGICLERGAGGRTAQVVAQLGALAPHASAAARLVQRARVDPALAPEARLRPDGQLVDATGQATSASAREALRAAVRGAEKARGRLRRIDPEEAMRLRVALVSGRWSLVDEFDTDGARYWLALENAPTAPATLARLTPRQRTVVHLLGRGLSDEAIAAELGISVATVDVHLRTAGARLVVPGRRGILAALAHPEGWVSGLEVSDEP